MPAKAEVTETVSDDPELVFRELWSTWSDTSH
jgi:hypothetical protein